MRGPRFSILSLLAIVAVVAAALAWSRLFDFELIPTAFTAGLLLAMLTVLASGAWVVWIVIRVAPRRPFTVLALCALSALIVLLGIARNLWPQQASEPPMSPAGPATAAELVQ